MPVKNVILIEKVAQILTIGLALGIKTIIITQLLHLIRNKKERKGEGERSTEVEELPEIWTCERLKKNRRIGNKELLLSLSFCI